MVVRLDVKTAHALVSDDVIMSLEMFRHSNEPEMRINETFTGMHGKKIGGAMLDLRMLRHRANQKFILGQDMFFTRALLEQASSEAVAEYRTQRFVDAGYTSIVDACCGCGSDAITLARAGITVEAYDINEITTIFATKNAQVCGVSDKLSVHLADCTEIDLPDGPIMLDPARRKGSKRIINPELWSPSPDAVAEMIKGRPAACLKLSPSVDLDILLELFPKPDEIEVISYRNEAKEMVFWYGELASGVERRATIVSHSEAATPDLLLQTYAGDEHSQAETASELGTYFYTPNKALLRSGLIGKLAAELGLKNIDPHIAYLTGDEAISNPFLDCMKIMGYDSFDPRKIRALMRKHKVGSIEVRKRGISESVPSITKRFLPKSYGDKRCVFIATRIGDSHVGILAELIK
jgi:hypothetical protein